ncbi:MAG TPA: carboxypeptidase-like regulatory domain-containing protein, partial [Holophaga sp.]|nr:carboxypeptidase-like regulatory domain-containing protein [Holophaga sp.]
MRMPFSKRSLLIVAAAPAILMAQGTTTAAVTGTVRDAQGKPVAGAVVRLSSPALIGGERKVTTNTNGGYRMPLLPPGRYRIVVEAEGFQPITSQETLELGRTSNLNWSFAPMASASVEVVAVAAEIKEVTPTGLGTNVALEKV